MIYINTPIFTDKIKKCQDARRVGFVNAIQNRFYFHGNSIRLFTNSVFVMRYTEIVITSKHK